MLKTNKKSFTNVIICLLIFVCTLSAFLFVNNKNFSVKADTNTLWTENNELNYINFNGDGTESNPYKITNAKELALLAKNVNTGVSSYKNEYFVLENDIDLSASFWEPIGFVSKDMANPSQAFEGNFDGKNHTIKAMTFDQSKKVYTTVGLFGYVKNYSDEEISIKNIVLNNPVLNLENSKRVSEYIGLIASYISGSSINISNCSVNNALVYGYINIGGIVGYNCGNNTINNNSVNKSKFYLLVEHYTNINNQISSLGGIIGVADGKNDFDHGYIENIDNNSISESTFEFTTDFKNDEIHDLGNNKYNFGGIVGILKTNKDLVINNLYSEINLTNSNLEKDGQSQNVNLVNTYLNAGGLIGVINLSKPKIIFNNCITKKLSFDVPVNLKQSLLGGFIANSEENYITINNSYSFSEIKKYYNTEIYGGFIGFSSKTFTINNSYTVINLKDQSKLSQLKNSNEKNVGYFVGKGTGNLVVTNGYSFNKNNNSILFNGHGNSSNSNSLGTILNEETYRKYSSYAFNFEEEWAISNSVNNGFPYLNIRPQTKEITAASNYEKGDGTIENPFVIANKEQLVLFANQINNGINSGSDKYFMLSNDIDLAGVKWTPIGNGSKQFQGNFNGCGYSILNLNNINNAITRYGLFGNAVNATIYNLNLENVDLTIELKGVNTEDTYYVAPLVAYCENTKIYEISVTGKLFVKLHNIIDVKIGGLAGYLKGIIDNCYSKTYIDVQTENTFNKVEEDYTALHSIGGLVGYLNGSMGNCYTRFNSSQIYSNLINVDAYSENTCINLSSLIGTLYIQKADTNVYVKDNFTTDILSKIQLVPNTLNIKSNLGAIIGKIEYNLDLKTKDYNIITIKNNHYRYFSKFLVDLSEIDVNIESVKAYIDIYGISDLKAKEEEIIALVNQINNLKEKIKTLENEIGSINSQLTLPKRYEKVLKVKQSLNNFETAINKENGLYELFTLLNQENNSLYDLTKAISTNDLNTLKNNIISLRNQIETYKSLVNNETDESVKKENEIVLYEKIAEYCLSVCDYITNYTNLCAQNFKNSNFEQMVVAIIVIPTNAFRLDEVKDLKIAYLESQNEADKIVIDESLNETTASEETINLLNQLKTKNENKLTLEKQLTELNNKYNDYLQNSLIEERAIGDIKKILNVKVSNEHLENYLKSLPSYDFDSIWTFMSGENDYYPILRKNTDKNTYSVTQNNIEAGNVTIFNIVSNNNLKSTKTLSTSKDMKIIKFANLSNDPYVIRAGAPKAGYRFAKWQIKETNSGIVSYVTEENLNKNNFSGTGKNYEITAIYEEIEFTISINGNGFGKFEVTENNQKVYKEEINIVGTVSGIKNIPTIKSNLKENDNYRFAIITLSGQEINKNLSITSNLVAKLVYIPTTSWADHTKQIEANSEGVFEIATAEELSYIAKCFNTTSDRAKVEGKKFVLTENIDLSKYEWEPIKDFFGNFNGNGYKIQGLRFNTVDINTSSSKAFIETTKSGKDTIISDLQLECTSQILLNKNSNFSSLIKTANGNVTIEGCVINTNLTAIKCEDSYDVAYFAFYGSLIGLNNSANSVIKNNLVNLKYNVTNSDVKTYISGLIGYVNESCTIENNLVNINVNKVDEKNIISGIIGVHKTTNSVILKNNYYITNNDTLKGVGTKYDDTNYSISEDYTNENGAVKFDLTKKQDILNLLNTSKYKANYDNNLTLYFNGYKTNFSIPKTSILGSASVDVKSNGDSGEYCYGDKITLSILVNKGYKFLSFKQNEVLSTDTEYSFILTPALEQGIFAEMDYDSYKLIVNLVSDNKNDNPGKVKINDGEFKDKLEEVVKFNSTVTLTVEEGKGVKFIGWFDSNGNKVYDEKTITFTMQNEDLTLTAKFENTNKILLPLLLLIGSIIVIVVIAILLVKKKRRYQQNKTN